MEQGTGASSRRILRPINFYSQAIWPIASTLRVPPIFSKNQTMTPKKELSWWQIWNMSFGFLGIQFGFALQNANTSRIFQTLGAEEQSLPILWLAAPVTGLLVQPIIGYYSDRTWHPVWGRRRPYFALGAILASLALIAMPNSPSLWMAAGMLWIMDASINISMEPFRAFVGDLLPPSQRTIGFAMQSFFIGIGAVVASALPWILSNWFSLENTAQSGHIAASVKWSYYIGAAVFLAAVLFTVFSTKEYPPNPKEQEENNLKTAPLNIKFKPRTYQIIGMALLVSTLCLAFWIHSQQLEKELYVLAGIFCLFGLAYLSSGILMGKNIYRIGFVQMVRDFQNMPKTMIQLAFVQFFSWFALFAMWIYTTSAVTSHIYGTRDTSSKLFNDGGDWVSVLFSVYNGIAALVAFGLPVLAKKIGRQYTHLISLWLGGIGLISIYFISNPTLLIVPMIGVGIAWASILSIPYALLSTSIPQHKMGYYMGIFNFFIVIPQMVAASILGYMVQHWFEGQSIFALIVGGISMLFAGFLNVFIGEKARVTAPSDL